MSAGPWSLNIAEQCKAVEEDLDAWVRTVVFEVWARLIYYSPVDTGRFRANWVYSADQPARVTMTVTGTTASPSPGAPLPAIQPGTAIGRVHWLSNNLPYALRLEYGYSKKQPDGIIRKTVAEFGPIAGG